MAVIPFRPGNDVITGLKWYYSLASPRPVIEKHYSMVVSFSWHRDLIPFQPDNDVFAGLKWYYSKAGPWPEITKHCFVFVS